ncbi:hypothetical protein ACFWB0_10185 [Rhodococcus sp. NPDC060086]|uniref:hypothetical protein n=1 Tax=Rhodococcus sp. NPDC060086 TaxID=3347055 RepID=UPI00365F6E9C
MSASTGPATDSSASSDSAVDSARPDGADKKAGPDAKAGPDETVDPEKISAPSPGETPLQTYDRLHADASHQMYPPHQPDGRQRSGPSRMSVLAVAVVAVLLGALAVVAAFRPGTSDGSVAWVDRAETAAVTEAAAYAIEAMHGYNFETIDEDFAEIRELLTDERREEFDSTAQVTKEAAVQTRTVTEVTVAHIGARMIDESKAEVAAYINVSATGDGVAQGSAAAPLLVRMEKADGRWLVSEIRDQ